jgi:hypothetical protein
MNLIQPLLVASLLMIGVIYLNRFRSRIIDRIIILLILATGIVFVCFPALTSRIANIVGVGRGADLLLYASLVSIGFLLTVFYAKIREMSQTITRLTREISLREVRKGGTENKTND